MVSELLKIFFFKSLLGHSRACSQDSMCLVPDYFSTYNNFAFLSSDNKIWLLPDIWTLVLSPPHPSSCIILITSFSSTFGDTNLSFFDVENASPSWNSFSFDVPSPHYSYHGYLDIFSNQQNLHFLNVHLASSESDISWVLKCALCILKRLRYSKSALQHAKETG